MFGNDDDCDNDLEDDELYEYRYYELDELSPEERQEYKEQLRLEQEANENDTSFWGSLRRLFSLDDY